MATQFVLEMKSSLDFALSLSEKFLSICPENIWKKQFGGWPVAQQFYHGVQVVGVFGSMVCGESFADPCPEAGQLAQKGGPQASLAQARELLDNAKALADKMATSLQDADLLAKNEGASQMMGRDTTNGAVVQLMASHLLYHLGSCDAALREEGLEGAF